MSSVSAYLSQHQPLTSDSVFGYLAECSSHMTDSLIHRFHQCLNPDLLLQLARDSGWCQRLRKIHPFEFLYSLVFGQLSAVHCTLNAQAQSLTLPVFRQAVDQRYTPAAVAYFQAAFTHTLKLTLEDQSPTPLAQLLQPHFAAVRLFDSTLLECDPSLAALFPACGGRASPAGLKVLLSFEYTQSLFAPLAVLPSIRSDQGLASAATRPVGRNELGIYDKGFYKGPALQDLAQRGGYFLIPYPHSVSVWQTDPHGQRQLLELSSELNNAVGPLVQWSHLGLGQAAAQLGPVRLVAFRLAEENANRRRDALRKKCRAYGRTPTAQALVLAGWLILVTNAPPEKLPTQAVGYLYRVRWQIELVFKQLKSIFRLEALPSQNDSRVQCEVWARLLCALLLFVFHRHANTLCWAQHQREISFAKLAKLLRQLGHTLARACFLGRDPLTQILNELWRKTLKHTRKEHQKTRKTTWQNLCDHWLLPLSSAPVSVGS
jgi:hypothetical protein